MKNAITNEQEVKFEKTLRGFWYFHNYISHYIKGITSAQRHEIFKIRLRAEWEMQKTLIEMLEYYLKEYPIEMFYQIKDYGDDGYFPFHRLLGLVSDIGLDCFSNRFQNVINSNFPGRMITTNITNLDNPYFLSSLNCVEGTYSNCDDLYQALNKQLTNRPNGPVIIRAIMVNFGRNMFENYNFNGTGENEFRYRRYSNKWDESIKKMNL